MQGISTHILATFTKPLVKSFSVESEAAAKIQIMEAAQAICGSSGFFSYGGSISKEEIDGVCTLMKGIRLKDTIEAIFAVQVVVSHLLGLRLLSKDGKTVDEFIFR